jgi:hypothetical protein
VNLGIVFLFDFLLPRAGGCIDLGNTLFVERKPTCRVGYCR